jgi:type IV pilus assembly protein PilX
MNRSTKVLSRNSLREGPRREEGAAMVIALVMLLVLTLLATASARMTLLEERMTGNTQDRNVAFQAAEAGLRAGEASLQVNVLPPFDNNAGGLFEMALPNVAPVWESVDWADQNAVLVRDDLAETPVSFVVEELPPVPAASIGFGEEVDEEAYFRVTSRGVGIGGNAAVTLQTTFKR